MVEDLKENPFCPLPSQRRKPKEQTAQMLFIGEQSHRKTILFGKQAENRKAYSGHPEKEFEEIAAQIIISRRIDYP